MKITLTLAVFCLATIYSSDALLGLEGGGSGLLGLGLDIGLGGGGKGLLGLGLNLDDIVGKLGVGNVLNGVLRTVEGIVPINLRGLITGLLNEINNLVASLLQLEPDR